MRITLSSPEITCDHCIATIDETVSALAGARFISGDSESRTFVVDIDSGTVLDRVSAALASAGYPLGPVGGAPEQAHSSRDIHPDLTAEWKPAAYRVEQTDVGANVNYDCYCGCDAGFALDRSQADPAAESCCCGNQILVTPDAGHVLRERVAPTGSFRMDVQVLTMPWGQPLEVALAIPVPA